MNTMWRVANVPRVHSINVVEGSAVGSGFFKAEQSSGPYCLLFPSTRRQTDYWAECTCSYGPPLQHTYR